MAAEMKTGPVFLDIPEAEFAGVFLPIVEEAVQRIQVLKDGVLSVSVHAVRVGFSGVPYPSWCGRPVRNPGSSVGFLFPALDEV